MFRRGATLTDFIVGRDSPLAAGERMGLVLLDSVKARCYEEGYGLAGRTRVNLRTLMNENKGFRNRQDCDTTARHVRRGHPPEVSGALHFQDVRRLRR
eukprot:6966039-Pyramimonas_sp.AAC.1